MDEGHSGFVTCHGTMFSWTFSRRAMETLKPTWATENCDVLSSPLTAAQDGTSCMQVGGIVCVCVDLKHSTRTGAPF